MEASSEEEIDRTNLSNFQDSFNETANSIHLQYGEQDQQMKTFNPLILKFIRRQLSSQIKFDDLQQRGIFSKCQHQLLKPFPFVYFLPYSILIWDKEIAKKLGKLQAVLEKSCEKYKNTKYDFKLKELNIRVHTQPQLVFYNIRCLKADFSLHKNPKMLDSKYLIDKLLEYYSHFYQGIHFQQTVILVLYWAFQKDLLELIIPQSALKVLIICNFINFGYGVDNIVKTESDRPEKIKEYKKMRSYCKMFRGETKVMDELKQQFHSYTFEEKKGFYMEVKKRHMIIKELLPVWFPLLPLSKEQQEKHWKNVNASLKGVVQYERQSVSIIKNVSKMFKFWHNKFSKPMRFVVDLSEGLGYRQQFSEQFQLQVIHPVFNESLCLLQDIPIRNFNTEINEVYMSFKKNPDVAKCLKKMLQKSRI